MQGTREIQRIGIGVLIMLIAVALSATYWAVAGQGTILQRDDNARRIEAIARIQRGSIYDHGGQLLAESRNDGEGIVRHYHMPSTFSLVGYYSLRYGAGLAEAAFHDLLNGSDEIRSLDDFVSRELLSIPQAGADVQLTASAELQQMLVSAMGDYRGAAVVMDARSGALLALASLPGYDPNSLDDDWDELASAPGDPFFHRALQGQYQPGSAILTFWLAEAIQAGVNLARRFDEADRPVKLGQDTSVTCVHYPHETDLSILEAFIYGCPSPFLELRLGMPAETFDSLARSFALADPINLVDFPSPEVFPVSEAAQADISDPEQEAIREALGQGQLTIAPLHLTAILSAIANEGRAPSPFVLAAISEPGAERWLPAPSEQHSLEMMTAETALQLRLALQQAWTTISDEDPSNDAIVGAQIAISQSGHGHQTWLYGFVRTEDDAIAFVLLLEDGDIVDPLISIGDDLVDALLGHLG